MELVADGVVARVDLEAGGRLASLQVHGHELLVTDRSAGVYGWGCYPMVPWAGRVRRGRFRFEDRDVTLPLGMPPHSIHGIGVQRPWKQTGPTGSERALDDPWPFGGRAVQTLDLTDGRLRMELTVEAERAMPAMVGWHPWFRRRLGAGDPLTLDFAPDAMLVRDDDGIPTGPTVAPPRGPWDDCFTGVRQPVELAWGDELSVELRSSCSHWVVYTEPDDAACVEPQSGPPDAFNWAPQIVTPDAPLTHWFEIRWR
jgi:aldose 1-epimerase